MSTPEKKIDSIYDFTDKGLVELKAWLEPWFQTAPAVTAAGCVEARYGFYKCPGNQVTVPARDSGTGAFNDVVAEWEWDGGSELLDLTDPTLPVVLATGLWIVHVNMIEPAE